MMVALLAFVLTTIAAIGFHELGHYLMSKRLRLKTRAGFDKKGFYVAHEKTSDKDRLSIVASGLFLGYFPLLLLAAYSGTLALLWFVGWSISNYAEFKLAFELQEKIDKEES